MIPVNGSVNNPLKWEPGSRECGWYSLVGSSPKGLPGKPNFSYFNRLRNRVPQERQR